MRRFGDEQGLAASSVWALAQDPVGFLWVGASSGLYRFDGTSFTPWGPDVVRGVISAIAVSPAGEVYAQTESGDLFAATSTGVTPIELPVRDPTGRRAGLSFDASGGLWAIMADSVLRRDPDGGWSIWDPTHFQNEIPRAVKTDGAGGVYVGTTEGVWRLQPSGTPRRVTSLNWVVDILAGADGRVLVLESFGRLYELSGDTSRLIWPVPADSVRGRGIALARRGSTIWVALDRYLVAIRPDEPAELLGPEDGIALGGPLLVDREGSLWFGAFTGLYQMPEPETRFWNERSGFPSSHAHAVIRQGALVWGAAFQGSAAISRTPSGWAVIPFPWHAAAAMCPDGAGALWVGTSAGLVRVHGTRFGAPDPAANVHMVACARSGDRGTWMATTRGLWDVAPGGRPRPVRQPFGDAAVINAVMEDRTGRLWIAVGERVCRAPAHEVREGARVAWACDDLPVGFRLMHRMFELEDGTVLASSGRAGVFRYDGAWHASADRLRLPTPIAHALVGSPRSGVWVTGSGFIYRVEPTGDHWRVLESLTGWHGLAVPSARDLMEDEDGTVWLATSRGVVRVPTEARASELPPPPVALVEARVDERRVPLDDALRLPAWRNRLALRFAALSFRDPSLVRYQVRLSASEEWTDVGGAPTFRWVDLRPGHYTAQVRASLDGEAWSPAPAAFAFAVLPPWYARPWVLALAALLLVAGLWAAHRARVAGVLRLERERTRIAMDLHDELGSGLGSIGILSGVLAADRVPDTDRQALAREIAAAAEELGASLSDIIWALEPRAATLEELASRLVEHGGRLFAGEGATFVARMPRRWPPGVLSLTQRRSLLLIGLEALHNVARHAGAREVTLTLAARDGDAWELRVEDDGRGLGDARSPNGGRGLPGMGRRAEEIGGHIEWRARPGGGTIVALRFGLIEGRGVARPHLRDVPSGVT